ncbi:uncharacterized protein PRCAT00001746001 [Priceomyces carsonii]|uniref:uncharacterized protein n=1 Tax=Priceomyces carsonii TaxID=28549 RepID=UPI002ED96C60|nr:unnamed protein product [Priceomyces carsonii]
MGGPSLSRSSSPQPQFSQRPTAKRSPSILVTDTRSSSSKGARAPFAGHKFKKQQQLLLSSTHHSRQPSFQARFGSRSNKYTDISVDKLLSNSSDIPSGQSRLPPLLNRFGRRSPPDAQGYNGSNIEPEGRINGTGAPFWRKNIRNIPNLSQPLPSRTSKTSQKLVLIPEQHQRLGSPVPHIPPQYSSQAVPFNPDLQSQIQRSRAELMSKEEREYEFCRMTAYFICEQFNIKAVSEFLKKNHEVNPRVYDEVLYIPYALPLLPGADGYRIKSNNSAKLLPNKRYMEKMINKSEQADHLYEYYSGFETPEDANNYSMDPELENFDNNSPFDPSEPQFFAPPIARRGGTELNLESNGEHTSQETKSTLETPKDELKIKKDQIKDSLKTHGNESLSELSKHHAEMFIFKYGVVVFWNFSEIHEKNILADLAFASHDPEPLLINPIDEQDIETEEFHFEYDSDIYRPRIYNDMITLRSGDHLIKLTMSHAIAQLTKLSLFESRMVNILQLISKLPKKLALTGKLGLKRHQLIKKSGKLFKLRVDVNLSSSILDTPDFFWSFEPALHPLYTAVREYLEIDQRVQVLNDRCKVFLEFLDVISDSMNELNTNRITWMIIIIIFMNLSVSVFEFILELL